MGTVWLFWGLCSWEQGDGLILRWTDLILICVWRGSRVSGTGWWDGWDALVGWKEGSSFAWFSRLIAVADGRLSESLECCQCRHGDTEAWKERHCVISAPI